MDNNSYFNIVSELYNLSSQGVQSNDVRFRQLLSALSSAREMRGPLDDESCGIESTPNNPVNKEQFERLLEQIDVISNYLSVGSEVPDDLLRRCGVDVTSLRNEDTRDSSNRDEILYYAEVLHRNGDHWGSNLGWVEYNEVLSEHTLSYTIKAVNNLRSLIQYAMAKGTPDGFESVEIQIRELGMEAFADGFRVGGILRLDRFLLGLTRAERQLHLLTLQRNFKRTLRFVRHLYMAEPSSADAWNVRSQQRQWGNHINDFINRNREGERSRSMIAHSVAKHVRDMKKSAEMQDLMRNRGRMISLKDEDPETFQGFINEEKQKQFGVLCKMCDSYMRGLISVSVGSPPVNEDSSASPLYRHRGIVYDLKISVLETVRDLPHSLCAGDVLQEHHREGLTWLLCMYNHNLNGLLADDYRLDRVLHVISFLAYIRDMKAVNGPHLIVVPLASMQNNWLAAFEEWYPACRICVYEGGKYRRRCIRNAWSGGGAEKPNFDVLFVTDHVFVEDRNYIRRIKWDYAIVDGVRTLNDPSGDVLGVLNSGFSIRRRLLLATEPPSHNVQELWSIVNFLFPEMYNTTDKFLHWLQEPFIHIVRHDDLKDIKLTDEEGSLIAEIFSAVINPFMKRRTVESCPSITLGYCEKLVYCPMSGMQTKLFNFLKAANVYDKTFLFQNACNHPYTFCPDTFPCDDTVITSSGKFAMLDICLSRLIPAGHRVLILSPADNLLNLLEVFMHLRSIKYIRVDESESLEGCLAKVEAYNRNGSNLSVMLATKASCNNMMLVDTDTLICFEEGITGSYVTENSILKAQDALLLRLAVPNVTDDPYLTKYEVDPPQSKARPNTVHATSRRNDFTSDRLHSLAYLDRLLTRSTEDERHFYVSSLNRYLAQNVMLLDDLVFPPCLVKSLVNSGIFSVEYLQAIQGDDRLWDSVMDSYDIWSANPTESVLTRSQTILNPDYMLSKYNTITGLPLGYPIDRVNSIRGVADILWIAPTANLSHQRMLVINELIKKALDLAMKTPDFVIFTQPYMRDLYGDFLNHIANPVNLNEVFQLAETGSFLSLGGLNIYLQRMNSNVRACHGVRSPIFFKALRCYNGINSFILRHITYSLLCLNDKRHAAELQMLYEHLTTLHE